MPLTFAQRATDLLSRFQRPDADRKLCISSKMNNDKFAENSVDPNPFRSPLFLFREQVGIESRLERWRTRATRRDIPSNWTTISITISVVSRSFVSEGAQWSPGKQVCKYVLRLCYVEEFDVDRSSDAFQRCNIRSTLTLHASLSLSLSIIFNLTTGLAASQPNSSLSILFIINIQIYK